MQFNFIIASSQADKIAMGDVFSIAVVVLGLILLCNWYVRLNGVRALSSSRIRRNNMPFFLPYAAVLLWVMAISVTIGLAEKIGAGKEDWVVEFFTYLFTGAVEIAMLVGFLFAAKRYFVRGLKGFGLGRKGLLPDAGWAMVNYLTVLPMVFLGLWVVLIIGTLIAGDNFQMTRHESLSTMMSDSPLILKAVVVFFAVIVAPVFEEVMFRGLFQSSIVSITGRRWLGIIVASIFFVMLHPVMHWLGLFALSVCMGYTYERSGSLRRAIFVHMIFNGISTAAALFGGG